MTNHFIGQRVSSQVWPLSKSRTNLLVFNYTFIQVECPALNGEALPNFVKFLYNHWLWIAVSLRGE